MQWEGGVINQTRIKPPSCLTECLYLRAPRLSPNPPSAGHTRRVTVSQTPRLGGIQKAQHRTKARPELVPRVKVVMENTEHPGSSQSVWSSGRSSCAPGFCSEHSGVCVFRSVLLWGVDERGKSQSRYRYKHWRKELRETPLPPTAGESTEACVCLCVRVCIPLVAEMSTTSNIPHPAFYCVVLTEVPTVPICPH